jgi:hypothetical protein
LFQDLIAPAPGAPALLWDTSAAGSREMRCFVTTTNIMSCYRCQKTVAAEAPETLSSAKQAVRFLEKMRLVSLETPEPDATVYQNLMRRNPDLTRSGAIKLPAAFPQNGLSLGIME